MSVRLFIQSLFLTTVAVAIVCLGGCDRGAKNAGESEPSVVKTTEAPPVSSEGASPVQKEPEKPSKEQELEQKNQELVKEKEGLEQKNASLTSEVSSLRDEVTRLKTSNEELNETIRRNKWRLWSLGLFIALLLGVPFSLGLGVFFARKEPRGYASGSDECPKCHWKLNQGATRCPNPDCRTRL